MASKKCRIACFNGVNLDLLGQREPELYGRETLSDIEQLLRKDAQQLSQMLKLDLEIRFFQSNHEGVFLEALPTKDCDYLIINPGAWTHTSLALADRLRAIRIPYVEVHLSQTYHRGLTDEIRSQSLTAPYASGVVVGLGAESYRAALYAIAQKCKKKV